MTMVYNVDAITAGSPPYNQHATIHYVSIETLSNEVDLNGGKKTNWRG